MSSSKEALSIPGSLRQEVWERDGGYCRRCGSFPARNAILHHIHYGGDYRGMGGRRLHTLDNIVVLCSLFAPVDCHAVVHGNKGLWVPVLEQVITRPGTTGLSLIRRQQRRSRRSGSRPASSTSR